MSHYNAMGEELTDRQESILRYIIGEYIASALPVGSRAISKRHNLSLSPATIRNVMANLEDLGYLNHPHPSAGRMPTDKGYRFYVNTLMEMENISDSDRIAIGKTLENTTAPEELFTEASRILGKISHQLSLVSSPHISCATLDRLDLISVSSTKVAAILSIRSGIVKTIMMEVSSEVRREKLDALSGILNERLSDHTLQHIRDTFARRVKDVKDEETGIIRLLMRSTNKLFDDTWTWSHVHIGGTPDVIHQPEFEKPETFRAFIRLVDDEEVLTHVLVKRNPLPGEITVTIGDEHQEDKLKDYSTVTSVYKVGDALGTVCVIGPKRMSYSRLIPLVDHMARTISAMLS